MSIEFFLKWLEINPEQPNSWYQVGICIIIILSVSVINHYLLRTISKRITSTDKGIQHVSLRAFQRLFAPLIALLLFMSARAILEHLGFVHKILDIAVPLAVSLAVIRITVYMLRKAFKATPFIKAWENIIVVIVWVLFALHVLDLLPGFIAALDTVAIKFGQSKITLLGSIKAILSVAIFVLIALWISNRIEKQLSKTEQLANYIRIGIAKTVRVIALIVAFLIGLDVIGFDLTTLTVLGGALGVGIGFGLQRIASNFISGFILIFDRSIRPNDVISIGESFGWVKELRARYVVIQDRDGVETLIPNENLVTSQVINWSYTDKNIRVKAPVQISYNNDPETAMKLMVEAANETNRVLKDPPAVARLLGFGDNGINLELRLWIDDPENGVNNVRSEANLAIWKKFKQHGINIPFPQRDVHLYEK